MKFLRTALVLNASSCILFGLLFLLFGNTVSQFIGSDYPWLIPLLGLVLLINGLHLVFASRRSRPICPEILYFVAGDLLWVAGTAMLIVVGVVITSMEGIVVSLLVALMVGSFALMQIKAYRQVCASEER